MFLTANTTIMINAFANYIPLKFLVLVMDVIALTKKKQFVKVIKKNNRELPYYFSFYLIYLLIPQYFI